MEGRIDQQLVLPVVFLSSGVFLLLGPVRFAVSVCCLEACVGGEKFARPPKNLVLTFRNDVSSANAQLQQLA
jgi:hypothetical protein